MEQKKIDRINELAKKMKTVKKKKQNKRCFAVSILIVLSAVLQVSLIICISLTKKATKQRLNAKLIKNNL